MVECPNYFSIQHFSGLRHNIIGNIQTFFQIVSRTDLRFLHGHTQEMDTPLATQPPPNPVLWG